MVPPGALAGAPAGDGSLRVVVLERVDAGRALARRRRRGGRHSEVRVGQVVRRAALIQGVGAHSLLDMNSSVKQYDPQKIQKHLEMLKILFRVSHLGGHNPKVGFYWLAALWAVCQGF